MGEIIQFNPELKCVRLVQNMPGASGGEIIWFVSRSERERARLIREARAMYDHVFPASDSVNEPRDKTLTTLTVNGANAHHGDKVLS